MKSVCIKMNNQKSIQYLLEKLNNFKLDDIYFSCKKFKIYNNIIIHYRGNNDSIFIKKLSTLLSHLVVDLFEPFLIKSLIKSEYFYFDFFEQKQISNNTFDDLYDKEEAIYSKNSRYKILYSDFYNYLKSNKSLVLKGFITFRIKNYLETILVQVDKSVNKYIIEKEYSEFISILKMYVNSEPSSANIIHLIYCNYKPTLLDENKNIINIDEHILNNKYLSDISFSSNDFALNALLSIIPQKIYIHLIDGNSDEFINTIKLIFEDRVYFCTDCSICKIYKKSHAIQN